MKKIIIFFISLTILFASSNITYGNNSEILESKVKSIFSTFIKNYEKRKGVLSSYNKSVSLEKNIDTIISSGKISGDKFTVYNTLLNESREYISNYLYQQELKNRENILSQYSISEDFVHKITSQEDVVLENGVWYGYIYKSFYTFPTGVIPTKRDLDYNNIDINRDLLIIKDGKVLFVTEYKKVKLISDDILYGIPDKLQFIKEVRDDKIHIQNETDNDFRKLKIITQNLVKDTKNKEEKISIIYNYILNNITYTQNINLEDKKIFSGIETFTNKDGVCEGYVKYFQYMLQFAGINDVESLRGYVIDAQDYPNIGHAWTKIGDNYYDPTFDDPIGQTKTKEENEYYYFKLPKDLFYTNRYDYGKDKPTLEKAPLSYREQYIKKNLVNIYPKYKGKGFNILKELEFRESYGFDLYKDITVQDFKEKYGYKKVNNFTYNENGESIRITKLNYFTLTNDTDLQVILKQLNYDLEGYKFYEWIDKSGNYFNRLGFNIQTN